MTRPAFLVARASRALLIILSSLALPGAAFAPSGSSIRRPHNGATNSPTVSVLGRSGCFALTNQRSDGSRTPQSASKWCFQYRPSQPFSGLPSTASPDEDASSSSVVGEAAAAGASDDNDDEKTSSFLQRVRAYFAPKKDNLSFRQRLAKMGLAAVLSYGWVSNMSYTVTVSLAWYIFSKKTGLSPLAPGQWKGFLAVYAGFWVFNNFVRPIRLAVSVAISPQFDRIVLSIQDRLKVSKATAITVTVVIANLFGTTFLMGVGILFASILAGVPIFPR